MQRVSTRSPKVSKRSPKGSKHFTRRPRGSKRFQKRSQSFQQVPADSRRFQRVTKQGPFGALWEKAQPRGSNKFSSGLSLDGRFHREFPRRSNLNFAQILKKRFPKDFQKVPNASHDVQEVPQGSRKVPNVSTRFHQVPEGSKWFQKSFPKIRTGSNRFQCDFKGFNSFPEVPKGSNRPYRKLSVAYAHAVLTRSSALRSPKRGCTVNQR